MGHDLYFVCPTGTAQTGAINVSYSFNPFYYIFNPTTQKKATGAELTPILTDAINRMNRVFMTLEPSKDPLKAIPGNYSKVLNLLLAYAKEHPTWIFHCD
jgi:hypothetical protein